MPSHLAIVTHPIPASTYITTSDHTPPDRLYDVVVLNTRYFAFPRHLSADTLQPQCFVLLLLIIEDCAKILVQPALVTGPAPAPICPSVAARSHNHRRARLTGRTTPAVPITGNAKSQFVTLVLGTRTGHTAPVCKHYSKRICG
jgi:hypothetical protein